MSDYINKQIAEQIKYKAKSSGLTQAAIANRLDVSLPTVKRWYAGKNLTIPSLKKLSDLLGFSLSELFSAIDSEKNQFQYTLSQENYLAKHPESLAFFDLLLRGKTIKQIQSQFKLKDRSLNPVSYTHLTLPTICSV